MTKCDLFVAVWLVLVLYTTRRVEGGIQEKLQEPVMAYQKDSGALLSCSRTSITRTPGDNST